MSTTTTPRAEHRAVNRSTAKKENCRHAAHPRHPAHESDARHPGYATDARYSRHSGNARNPGHQPQVTASARVERPAPTP